MHILGTSVEAIDACEDRKKFSRLCDTWIARGLWHGGPPHKYRAYCILVTRLCCLLLFFVCDANSKQEAVVLFFRICVRGRLIIDERQ